MVLTYRYFVSNIQGMKLVEYLKQPDVIAAHLCREIGVKPPRMVEWGGNTPVPVKHCVLIEQATNGVVTRKDLRPDDWHLIWPELAEKETA